MISLQLWIAKVGDNLQDCLPKSNTRPALNSYTVFAIPFDTTENYSDKANLSKACEILRSSEKKFENFSTQLEPVSKGAYIGIRTATEILVIAKCDTSVIPLVQLSRHLKTAEEGVWLCQQSEQLNGLNYDISRIN